jgi:hypothetical protein
VVTTDPAPGGWYLDLGAIAGVLVVVNLITVADWRRSTIIVAQVAGAIVAVAGARWRGYTLQELGLAVERARSD